MLKCYSLDHEKDLQRHNLTFRNASKQYVNYNYEAVLPDHPGESYLRTAWRNPYEHLGVHNRSVWCFAYFGSGMYSWGEGVNIQFQPYTGSRHSGYLNYNLMTTANFS